MSSVRAEGLGVRFGFDRQQRPVTPIASRIRRHCTFSWALRDLTLSIGPGESVGLIGANGAGKTTLLRVLAGVLPADDGRVEVDGRVGSLLSIQAGVMSSLTGRENALLLGVLNGGSRKASRASLDEICDRSGLGTAFNRPVSSYSQGMRARLGFAVVAQKHPEVLLLDEVHEALDADFRAVMEAHVRQILDAGGIVVAAGHDHHELARLCTRAILLDQGQAVDDGSLADLVARSA